MGWLGWAVVGIVAFDCLFFSIIGLIAFIQDRRDKCEQHTTGHRTD